MTRYRVLCGLNYPVRGSARDKRAEIGDVVTDLPKDAVGWLLEQGYIEPAKPPTSETRSV